MFRERSQYPDDSLENQVQALTGVFNLSHVQTEVAEGEGWKCSYSEQEGFSIIIDPLQLAEEGGDIDPAYVKIASRHELSHLKDMLGPHWKYDPLSKPQNVSDRLFWNFIHDVTIDGRTARSYEEYRNSMPELYNTLMKTEEDQLDQPKHIQFAKAMRSQMVLDEASQIVVSDDVQEQLDKLRNYNGHDIAHVLIHKGTTLKQRVEIGEKIIKPIYDSFLEEDEQKTDKQELEKQAQETLEQSDMTKSTGNNEESEDDKGSEGDQESFDDQMRGAAAQYREDIGIDSSEESGSSGDGEAKEQAESKSGNKSKKMLDVAKAMADAIKDNIRPSSTAQQSETDQSQAGKQEESEANNLAGKIKKEMNLNNGKALEYARVVVKNKQLIYRVAEVFTYLANVNEVQTRIKRTRAATTDGASLHSKKLPSAYVQGLTDVPMPIWHRKKRVASKQELTFDGLDFWIITDASSSMDGAPADSAATLEVVLAEGLLLARDQQKQELIGSMPDVRMAGLIFGSSTATVMPLSHEPSAADRAKMFINTKEAGQDSTLVCDSLKEVFRSATANPERDVVCFVISDNVFGDNPSNLKNLKPDNCSIINLILPAEWSSPTKLMLGEYSKSVKDAHKLPVMLAEILENYRQDYVK